MDSVYIGTQAMIDYLPRCDDGKKLGSEPYQTINLRKKNINALNFLD